MERKEEIQIRKTKKLIKKKQKKNKKSLDPTEEILTRFIKKTKEQETGYEYVNDHLKETNSKSQISNQSRPLTLRETLSKNNTKREEDSNDTDMIKNLKHNVMLKSYLYGTKENSTLRSEITNSIKIDNEDNGNNHSVFRFNKFENEKSKDNLLRIIF